MQYRWTMRALGCALIASAAPVLAQSDEDACRAESWEVEKRAAANCRAAGDVCRERARKAAETSINRCVLAREKKRQQAEARARARAEQEARRVPR